MKIIVYLHQIKLLTLILNINVKSISTSSNDTFWDDVVNDIKQSIESSDSRSKLYTEKAEEIHC